MKLQKSEKQNSYVKYFGVVMQEKLKLLLSLFYEVCYVRIDNYNIEIFSVFCYFDRK